MTKEKICFLCSCEEVLEIDNMGFWNSYHTAQHAVGKPSEAMIKNGSWGTGGTPKEST